MNEPKHISDARAQAANIFFQYLPEHQVEYMKVLQNALTQFQSGQVKTAQKQLDELKKAYGYAE